MKTAFVNKRVCLLVRKIRPKCGFINRWFVLSSYYIVLFGTQIRLLRVDSAGEYILYMTEGPLKLALDEMEEDK